MSYFKSRVEVVGKFLDLLQKMRVHKIQNEHVEYQLYKKHKRETLKWESRRPSCFRDIHIFKLLEAFWPTHFWKLFTKIFMYFLKKYFFFLLKCVTGQYWNIFLVFFFSSRLMFLFYLFSKFSSLPYLSTPSSFLANKSWNFRKTVPKKPAEFYSSSKGEKSKLNNIWQMNAYDN